MKTKAKGKSNYSLKPKAIYTPADLAEIGFDYSSMLGDPGFFPFVRGIETNMYRNTPWIMGQYGGYGTAEDTNQRYKHLIAQGASGISIALDLPTQIGYDSDHPLAQGEVGRVGVAIDSLKDMELLFDGIPIEKLRQIRTTANAIGPIFVALFLALAEKRGLSPRSFSGYLQNDILKEYVARGTYIFPPKQSLKLCTDVIEFCSVHLPSWVPINFCGYHMRDAGCTAVQEIAFTLANGIAYIEASLNRGLEIDQFAPKITCFFGAGIDLIEEIAKFRAARRVWATLMKERFGAKEKRSLALKIFTYTLGSNLVSQQPLNNIVRVTLEALSAVLGGTQILATSSYDEALCTPSVDAATVALRTQQIIAYESGLTETADPLGGSYCLERRTYEIENNVWEYLEKIENDGGAVQAIEEGIFQREIEEAAYKMQTDIETRKKVVVGVNMFESSSEMKIDLQRVSSEVEKRQCERLSAVKKARDNRTVKEKLAGVKRAAIQGENIIPSTVDAVKVYATVGEICDTLRGVYGEHAYSRFVVSNKK
jgi:methylmalonyl-CoA mutase N-terminal domain/subunit